MSIITEVRGYGTSVATYLINIDEVAKSINASPEEILQYMSHELGTRIYNKIGLRGFVNSYIVNDVYDNYITQTKKKNETNI